MAVALRCFFINSYTVYHHSPKNAIGPVHNQPSGVDQRSKFQQYSPVFTTEQLSSIRYLVDMLRNEPESSPVLVEAIDSLLETIYMPNNTYALYGNPYATLSTQFLCLRSIHSGGGFIDPRYITHYLTANQFGVRHTLFVYAHRLWKEMGQNLTQEELEGQDWFR